MTTKTRSHQPINRGRVIVLCGVSGSGKSTVGQALAKRLDWHFIEGDSFHPHANIAKMQRNEPLNDSDRESWLYRLRDEIKNCLAQEYQTILACSALKARYRAILCLDCRVNFVFLIGKHDLLRQRLTQRTQHFMGPDLLKSQMDTLELPQHGLIVDINQSVPVIVELIVSWLASKKNGCQQLG